MKRIRWPVLRNTSPCVPNKACRRPRLIAGLYLLPFICESIGLLLPGAEVITIWLWLAFAFIVWHDGSHAGTAGGSLKIIQAATQRYSLLLILVTNQTHLRQNDCRPSRRGKKYLPHLFFPFFSSIFFLSQHCCCCCRNERGFRCVLKAGKIFLTTKTCPTFEWLQKLQSKRNNLSMLPWRSFSRIGPSSNPRIVLMFDRIMNCMENTIT